MKKLIPLLFLFNQIMYSAPFAVFPNIEKSTIEKFLLGFLLILFCLSLGNTDNISPNIF